jgi:hypothetical protein
MTKEEFDAADNSKLDGVVVRMDRRANSKGFPLRFPDQFGQAIAKRHIIKGIFARGETSAWIAPPGGLKSALMAEASIHIAAGLDWHGRRNKDRCGVLYFALERADLEVLPIAIVNSTIDLMNPAIVPKVVETIQEAEACFGCSAGFVIFDTFAKLIAAGGGDENSAKDQGRVFANIQRLKDTEKIDIHAALVGHTGKDTTKGWRGSNAGIGDADLVVEISGDIVKTATVTKANDAPEGPLFSFKSETHEFGTDEDGDPITVNIVSAEEVSHAATGPREPRLTENQEAMLRLLRDAGSPGMTGDDWNAKARHVGIGVTRRSTLVNLKGQLKDKGLVREFQGVWHVQR